MSLGPVFVFDQKTSQLRHQLVLKLLFCFPESWIIQLRQILTYYNQALTTVLVYHFILTFEVCYVFAVWEHLFDGSEQEERKYIWEQRKTIPFFLFLVIRYLPILALLIDNGFTYNLASISAGLTIGFLSVCTFGWLRVGVTTLASAAAEGMDSHSIHQSKTEISSVSY